MNKEKGNFNKIEDGKLTNNRETVINRKNYNIGGILVKGWDGEKANIDIKKKGIW